RPVEAEMTLDQRQRAAPDRAEADHDDRAGDLAMDRKSGVGHFSELPAALIGGVKPQKYDTINKRPVAACRQPQLSMASSSSIRLSIIDRPLFQKPGSDASSPKGASSSE